MARKSKTGVCKLHAMITWGAAKRCRIQVPPQTKSEFLGTRPKHCLVHGEVANTAFLFSDSPLTPSTTHSSLPHMILYSDIVLAKEFLVETGTKKVEEAFVFIFVPAQNLRINSRLVKVNVLVAQ